MAEKSEGSRARSGAVPIPLDPVDLLAGLAPGVELEADAMATEAGGETADGAAVATVAEVGKLVRAGEEAIRRLIRTPALRPAAPGETSPEHDPDVEYDRAGVVPRTRQRPGE